MSPCTLTPASLVESTCAQERSPWFVLAFAVACALGSIYGFLKARGRSVWPSSCGVASRFAGGCEGDTPEPYCVLRRNCLAMQMAFDRIFVNRLSAAALTGLVFMAIGGAWKRQNADLAASEAMPIRRAVPVAP